MGAADSNTAVILPPAEQKRVRKFSDATECLSNVPALDRFEIFGVKLCFRHQLNKSHGSENVCD